MSLCEGMLVLGVTSTAQLKCSNAPSMGNKPWKPLASGICDVVIIMEMWWDDWGAAVNGYKLFRRDRRGRRGRGVALCIGEGFRCTELRDSGDGAECLW